MEHRSIKFEIKSFDENTGEFEGIASAFRKTQDKTKDIVRPGAFQKTINDNGGEVMLTFPPHDINSPVGKGLINEIPRGLFVKGILTRGVQKAEEAYLHMKAGVIKTLSIGYDTVKSEIKEGIRYLTEIKLYEIALVPGILAADDEAVITAVKTVDEKEVAADYPWDECIADQTARYGDEETARRVCGAIRAANKEKVKESLNELLPKAEALLDIKPIEKTIDALPEGKAAPGTFTDEEAAQIESALKGIHNEIEDEEVKRATTLIEVELAKIK